MTINDHVDVRRTSWEGGPHDSPDRAAILGHDTARRPVTAVQQYTSDVLDAKQGQ